MSQVLVSQIAAEQGVSRRTVLRMIQAGELIPVDKLSWSRTGPYVLDSDQVAEAFAARAAKTAPA